MKKLVGILLMVGIISLTLVGCGGGKTVGDRPFAGVEIKFADAGWDSIKFHNAVAGTIAQGVWGYSWSEVSGSTPVTFQGLTTGEIDAYMEVWTDNIASYKDDLANGMFHELGINFDDNYQGIYVPRYVIEGDAERGIEASAPDLKYIWDLKNYPDVFPDDENPGMGRVYGAIPGWEVDEILHKKYLHYGLDENFIYFRPGSEAALATAITSAYEKGEPVAAYYWEPTWLLGKYDMVLLEDEPYNPDTYLNGETEMPAVKVTIAVSNKFQDDGNEELIAFLSKYRTSSQLTSDALAYMQDTGSNYVDTAKWFLNENSQLLDEWLEPEDAQKMKDFLNK